MKSGALVVALVAGAAGPGYAGDPPKLALSGSAWITTDYMFRSISNTNQNPAAQVEFDRTYGIFWLTFGDPIPLSAKTSRSTTVLASRRHGAPSPSPSLASIIPIRVTTILAISRREGGASWTGGAWTLSVNDYWSPDNVQFFGESNAIEGTVKYEWTWKLWNFFTPSVSGTVGFQSYDVNADDYTYWNAGLTLTFLEHWSADIRYYDTDYNSDQCLAQSGGRNNCDARAVGYIKAKF